MRRPVHARDSRTGTGGISAIRPARAIRAAIAAAAALALAACSASAGDGAPGASGTDEPGGASLSGSITVFAAASLHAPFTQLAERFEEAHPEASIDLSFAGSSDLATQLGEGAPADVFASADEANMARLTDAGVIGPDAPVDFATNVLTIAVPAGNPAGITSLADLEDPDLRVVVCAPQVPCGAATERVEHEAGVTLTPVSEESAVTDVLGKVTSGEADAGLVYVTDVAGASGAVEGVDFPEASAAVNRYPIAPVAASEHPEIAAAFVEFVTGETGQAVLAEAGFGAP